jgi:hypothetical protein
MIIGVDINTMAHGITDDQTRADLIEFLKQH